MTISPCTPLCNNSQQASTNLKQKHHLTPPYHRGNRQPPPSGVKRFWRDSIASVAKVKSDTSRPNISSVHSPPQKAASSSSLKANASKSNCPPCPTVGLNLFWLPSGQKLPPNMPGHPPPAKVQNKKWIYIAHPKQVSFPVPWGLVDVRDDAVIGKNHKFYRPVDVYCMYNIYI